MAKARKREYCVVLRAWDNPANGSLTFIVGFTDVKDAEIKQEFGALVDDNGENREYLSVSDLDSISAKLIAHPDAISELLPNP